MESVTAGKSERVDVTVGRKKTRPLCDDKK